MSVKEDGSFDWEKAKNLKKDITEGRKTIEDALRELCDFKKGDGKDLKSVDFSEIPGLADFLKTDVDFTDYLPEGVSLTTGEDLSDLTEEADFEVRKGGGCFSVTLRTEAEREKFKKDNDVLLRPEPQLNIDENGALIWDGEALKLFDDAGEFLPLFAECVNLRSVDLSGLTEEQYNTAVTKMNVASSSVEFCVKNDFNNLGFVKIEKVAPEGFKWVKSMGSERICNVPKKGKFRWSGGITNLSSKVLVWNGYARWLFSLIAEADRAFCDASVERRKEAEDKLRAVVDSVTYVLRYQKHCDCIDFTDPCFVKVFPGQRFGGLLLDMLHKKDLCYLTFEDLADGADVFTQRGGKKFYRFSGYDDGSHRGETEKRIKDLEKKLSKEEEFRLGADEFCLLPCDKILFDAWSEGRMKKLTLPWNKYRTTELLKKLGEYIVKKDLREDFVLVLEGTDVLPEKFAEELRSVKGCTLIPTVGGGGKTISFKKKKVEKLKDARFDDEGFAVNEGNVEAEGGLEAFLKKAYGRRVKSIYFNWDCSSDLPEALLKLVTEEKLLREEFSVKFDITGRGKKKKKSVFENFKRLAGDRLEKYFVDFNDNRAGEYLRVVRWEDAVASALKDSDLKEISFKKDCLEAEGVLDAIGKSMSVEGWVNKDRITFPWDELTDEIQNKLREIFRACLKKENSDLYAEGEDGDWWLDIVLTGAGADALDGLAEEADLLRLLYVDDMFRFIGKKGFYEANLESKFKKEACEITKDDVTLLGWKEILDLLSKEGAVVKNLTLTETSEASLEALKEELRDRLKDEKFRKDWSLQLPDNDCNFEILGEDYNVFCENGKIVFKKDEEIDVPGDGNCGWYAVLVDRGEVVANDEVLRGDECMAKVKELRNAALQEVQNDAMFSEDERDADEVVRGRYNELVSRFTTNDEEELSHEQLVEKRSLKAEDFIWVAKALAEENGGDASVTILIVSADNMSMDVCNSDGGHYEGGTADLKGLIVNLNADKKHLNVIRSKGKHYVALKPEARKALLDELKRDEDFTYRGYAKKEGDAEGVIIVGEKDALRLAYDTDMKAFLKDCYAKESKGVVNEVRLPVFEDRKRGDLEAVWCDVAKDKDGNHGLKLMFGNEVPMDVITGINRVVGAEGKKIKLEDENKSIVFENIVPGSNPHPGAEDGDPFGGVGGVPLDFIGKFENKKNTVNLTEDFRKDFKEGRCSLDEFLKMLSRYVKDKGIDKPAVDLTFHMENQWCGGDLMTFIKTIASKTEFKGWVFRFSSGVRTCFKNPDSYGHRDGGYSFDRYPPKKGKKGPRIEYFMITIDN